MSKAKASNVPPTTIYLFGAHGDLVRRLLVPALYRLACAGLLPDDVEIIGVDHNKVTDEDFRARLGEFMLQLAADPCAEGGGEPIKKRQWARFAQRLSYLEGDFLELAEECGMTDPISAETIRGIAETIKDHFGL